MEKTVKTPRGTFFLVEGEYVEELKKMGYGYHHEYGEYVIISNGTSAVAVAKEDYIKYIQ